MLSKNKSRIPSGFGYHFQMIALVLLLTTCKEKDNAPSLPQVNDQFKEYVLRFISEAKARNVQVDVSNLKIESVMQAIAMNGVNYCGYTFSTLPSPSVQIALTSYCWNDQTDLNREILIFHELGHALLRRSHDDAILSNGLKKSMMQSGNQFDMYTEFTPLLRTYYLDELFNPSASPSSVIIKHSSTRIIFQDSISSPSSWEFIKSSGSPPHTGTISSTEYASPRHALSISSSEATGVNQFSYFGRSIAVTGVPATSELIINVMIKLKGVTKGASIAVDVISQGKRSAFYTTQGAINLTGTQDFTQYPVKIPVLPEKADSIYVYLIFFGENTGAILFDDIQVVNNF